MPSDLIEDGSAGLRVVAAAGPRAVETQLLAHVAAWCAAAAAHPQRLASPLRILVPSRSLRDHLAERVPAHLGRPAVGVAIDTLFSLGLQVVSRAGADISGGDALFPILVRRFASREPALRDALERFDDGYGAVESSVSDLLDAGIEVDHGDALIERLHEEGAGAAVERACSLVRVALATQRALAEIGCGHRSLLLRRAADLLRDDPLLLRAGSVAVHGFADATGVVTDLLEVVVRSAPALVLLDEPREPGAPDRVDPGVAFAERFRERLAGLAPVECPKADEDIAPVQLALVAAPGAEAEARAVAEGARARIDAGARPERIGVVARSLDGYAGALRVQLERLGVPYSGVAGLAPGGAASRRAAALLALLEQRERAHADHWLSAQQHLPAWGRLSRAARDDLRLGLRHLGAGRLRDVAELPDASEPVRLPVRRGLRVREPEDDTDEEASAYAERRRLGVDLLNAALRAARGAVDALAAWPEQAPLDAHAEALRGLLYRQLGWPDDDGEPIQGALAAQLAELPPGVELGRADFAGLVRSALARAGRAPLGGAGGGVQVLGVVEARARSFDHLFVVGLGRDVFPRNISEDPLLSDALRGAIAELLPEIPIKRRGFDEERFLFAQLFGSSPDLTLLWQSASDEGKQRSASGLIERLRSARPELVVEVAPALVSQRDTAALRPAREHAIAAGVHGSFEQLADRLPAALAESLRFASAPAEAKVADLASGRLAVLRELDAAPHPALGPYFGFVGPILEPADPRSNDLYVTRLEALARCSWKAFLEKVLGVEPVPDPLEALPEVDALLLGNLVHRVLEQIVRRSLPEPQAQAETLDAVAGCDGVRVAFPDDAELARVARAEAPGVLDQRPASAAGLVRALVERALPRLRRARELVWEGGPRVLGVELEGSVALPGGDRIRFRADRVDRDAAGLLLVDYKTGRPFSSSKVAATRARHFGKQIESARALQGVAYASTEGAALGRYVFLDPDPDRDAETLTYETAPGEHAQQFEPTVAALVRAWREGAFVPRLAESGKQTEPHACSYCSFSDACLRGDSGARARLVAWGEREDARAGAAEDAALDVWKLGGSRPAR